MTVVVFAFLVQDKTNIVPRDTLSACHFCSQIECAPDVQAKEVPLQDLAVRFSCATRELQFLGLIKEASRSRRDGAVQRLAYPMRVQTA